MRKSSTKGATTTSSKSSSHLYYFPLSTVIVDGASNSLTSALDFNWQSQQEEENVKESRKSVNSSRSKSISSATGSQISAQLYTNDTSSTCSSGQMTIDSAATFTEYNYGRSFNVPCIIELRDRFQQYLKTTSGNSGEYLQKLHKLMFLDEFFDPTKNRRKRIANGEELFRMCDQYLTLIHVQSKNSLSFSLLNLFPYLNNFEEMVKIQPENSILKNHEYLVKWFKKQSENLKKYLAEKASHEQEGVSPSEESPFLQSFTSPTLGSYITSPTLSYPGSDVAQPLEKKSSSNLLLDEYLDEKELKLIFYMLSTEMEDYFSLFQKSNVKYMKKWLEKNVKSLPNYLIDILSKKRKKYLHYHENYKLSEEDLNMKTILDSDFEFIQYLSEHTEDWKILIDSSPIIAGFKSKENYCKFTDMKMQKFITTVNYSLENVLKTMLANVEEIGGDNMIESSEYHHYTEIDPSISSRKYSTVIQTSLWNYGSFFKKRSLENVMSCRATFCGDEMQDATHLYKTCSYVSNKNEDSKAPIKIIVVGGRFYSKIDSNKTRIVDVRMFNVGGMVGNFDFVTSNKIVVKKSTDGILEYLKKAMTKAEQEGFPVPDNTKYIWRTLADYCRVHCKVDIAQ